MALNRFFFQICTLTVLLLFFTSSANGVVNEAKTFNEQGFEMSRNGSYTEALQLFDQALALDPQSTEVLRTRLQLSI